MVQEGQVQPQAPAPEYEPSIRGLVDSEFASPLRKFYGVFDSYLNQPEEGSRKARIALNFRELEVLASVEPYPWPTATISIARSNRKNSAWGIYSQSLAECIPDEEDLKDQLNKRLLLEVTPGHDYGFKDEQGVQIIRDAWEVMEVAGKARGATTTSAQERAKQLLDGKTMPDFNSAALADPLIRADTDLQRAITDRSFVQAMLQTGEFTKDENDIFHRAIQPAQSEGPVAA